MIYKIIVDKQPMTNPSEEKKEYEVDIEELRFKHNVYDSLIITKGEDYVMRRLELQDYNVLVELDPPRKEPLTDLNIELFEGENYIYLYDMTGNKIVAQYLIKNEFNELYVLESEMHSAITQSANAIELYVQQNYETLSHATSEYARIDLNAQGISTEVASKVGNNEVISKINQSAEQIQINANKISLAGKTIDMTSDNINITSNNLIIDEDGNMKLIDNETDDASVYTFEVVSPDVNESRKVGIKPWTIRIKNDNFNGIINLFTAAFSGLIIADKNNQQNGQSHYVFSDGTSQSDWEYNNVKTTVTPNGITTPTLTQTSLESEKKNFNKLENGLDIIKDIDIYKYNLKAEEDDTKKHIGFVIGDKYKYSEEVTSKGNDGVEIYSFVSVCCKAIQEQQEQIEELKARIEKLEKGDK